MTTQKTGVSRVAKLATVSRLASRGALKRYGVWPDCIALILARQQLVDLALNLAALNGVTDSKQNPHDDPQTASQDASDKVPAVRGFVFVQFVEQNCCVLAHFIYSSLARFVRAVGWLGGWAGVPLKVAAYKII